jgi:hypothetical protein
MKDNNPGKIKKTLTKVIHEISNNKNEFVKNPEHDHVRKRKISFEGTMLTVLGMSGGSLTSELLSQFKCSKKAPSAAALVQQRNKILPSAFEKLFHDFTRKTSNAVTYKGYRLLAVDGSDIHIPTNKDDLDSYYPRINDQRPYSLLHLNAMFDLLEHTYVDAIIQKSRKANESIALVDMVERFETKQPAIVIADRGYESYNSLAHIQEKGWKFLLRVKDATSKGGIASGLKLPDKDEFDISIDLHLAIGRSAERRTLYQDKNKYKRISHPETFDFFKSSDGIINTEAIYHLPFRIVKVLIEDGSYETIITNLDSNEFSMLEIKKLYFMRWGIETSFRHLKYSIGLLNFHSKKTNSIIQEIFTRLIMYNFTELIASHATIQQKDRKHQYKVNFSAAVHICRKFICGEISPHEILALISRYILPIRLGRKYPRRKTKDRTTVSFNYRLA